MGISARLSYTSQTMAHLVLSRKLRPKKFEEVAGQDHIVSALKNTIRTNRLGHAYLFAGTRGVGKTTIARIFSRAIRCVNRDENMNPCGQCDSCLNSDVDIIEIDGASNNSVENIRDLISTVQYLPTNGPYRVFIIDEVHMLSTSAFNALLKTLEEPPEHVKFLFATTDPQKLIDTVLSRCIRYDLRPLSAEQLIQILNGVVEKEAIKIDSPKVVQLISGCAKGSLRDALSLMEQALSFSDGSSISFQDLEDALGIANLNDVKDLVLGLFEGAVDKVQSIYSSIVAKGIFLDQLCSSILDQVYEQACDNQVSGVGVNESMWVYETLAKDFKWSLDSISPFQAVSLVLKKVALRRTFFTQTVSMESSSVRPDSSADLSTDPSTEVEMNQNEVNLAKENTEAVKKKIISESLEVLEQSGKQQPIAQANESAQSPQSEDHPELDENRDFSFEGFLNHVGEYSPAMRTNLQHGNFLKPLEIEDKVLTMEIGFKPSSQVFADYFLEKEISEKLIDWSKRYFDVDRVDLKIVVVSSQEEQEDFSSVNEQIIKEEEKEREIKQKNLEESENVKIAEKLFSAKIDKVILNEKN